MQVSFLVCICIFVYIKYVVADVKVLWPGANDTLHGNSWVDAIITESGDTPLITDLESISLSLCSGNNSSPAYLWTVYNITYDASSTSYPTYFAFFMFPFIADDDTNVYFFCIDSTLRSNESVQVINYSPRFTLDNMNGTISPDLAAINLDVAGDAQPDRAFTCNGTTCASTIALAGLSSASTGSASSGSNGNRTARIVGGTVAGAFAVGLCSGIAIFCHKKRHNEKRKRRPRDQNTEEQAAALAPTPLDQTQQAKNKIEDRISRLFRPNRKSKIQWWDELPPPNANTMELPADMGSYSLAELGGVEKRLSSGKGDSRKVSEGSESTIVEEGEQSRGERRNTLTVDVGRESRRTTLVEEINQGIIAAHSKSNSKEENSIKVNSRENGQASGSGSGIGSKERTPDHSHDLVDAGDRDITEREPQNEIISPVSPTAATFTRQFLDLPSTFPDLTPPQPKSPPPQHLEPFLEHDLGNMNSSFPEVVAPTPISPTARTREIRQSQRLFPEVVAPTPVSGMSCNITGVSRNSRLNVRNENLGLQSGSPVDPILGRLSAFQLGMDPRSVSPMSFSPPRIGSETGTGTPVSFDSVGIGLNLGLSLRVEHSDLEMVSPVSPTADAFLGKGEKGEGSSGGNGGAGGGEGKVHEMNADVPVELADMARNYQPWLRTDGGKDKDKGKGKEKENGKKSRLSLRGRKIVSGLLGKSRKGRKGKEKEGEEGMKLNTNGGEEGESIEKGKKVESGD